MKKVKQTIEPQPLTGADLVAFLRGQADAAVSLFADALNAMRHANHATMTAIEENKATIGQLVSCNEELQQMADKNATIINNFNRLLNGDTETTN